MLNITLKCLWFFPGILQTLLWRSVGWGRMGPSCPASVLLQACATLHMQHKHVERSCRSSYGCPCSPLHLEPRSVSLGSRPQNFSPHPPQEHHNGPAPTLLLLVADLSCLVLLFNPCAIFPLSMYYFLPPRQTKMAIPMLCIFYVSAHSTNVLCGCGDSYREWWLIT